MTSHRLFPSASGPDTPANYRPGDSFLSGVNFTVSQGGCWFEGYWWWVCPDAGPQGPQSTDPVECALWAVSGHGTGVVVPGSVVMSGTLAAGAWNYIPLPEPVGLAPGFDPVTPANGSAYVAAVGCNGPFPDTPSFWGSRIVNGPLVGYASGEVPWTMPQGCFSTAGSDPSTDMPGNTSGTDNFWVDVQVSDTVPAGYRGSYRLRPHKADLNPAQQGDAAVAYNIAMQADLTQACALNYIRYFVPGNVPAAAGLATRADVWDIGAQSVVASIPSPAWTTEDGGAVTLGASPQWVKAAFAPGVTLPPGRYRWSVYNADGAAGTPLGWSSKDAATGYWSTGVGANGIVNGPLSAPNQADAEPATFYPAAGSGTTGGQPVFAYSGSDVYPSFTTGLNPAQDYGIDVEVTPLAVPSSGLLMAGII